MGRCRLPRWQGVDAPSRCHGQLARRAAAGAILQRCTSLQLDTRLHPDRSHTAPRPRARPAACIASHRNIATDQLQLTLDLSMISGWIYSTVASRPLDCTGTGTLYELLFIAILFPRCGVQKYLFGHFVNAGWVGRRIACGNLRAHRACAPRRGG